MVGARLGDRCGSSNRRLSKTRPRSEGFGRFYGMLVRSNHSDGARGWEQRVWLRFVEGRPVSPITTQFLGWCCDKLAAEGKKALLLIWDNASSMLAGTKVSSSRTG
jgi:hypothetical protein